MNTRKAVAAALKPMLPSRVKLIDVPRSIDGLEVNKPVVLLYREKRSKAPNAIGDYQDTLALWVITPGVDPARAEDALDDILDDVILAVDSVKQIQWTSADRSIFGDSQAPAYRIELTVIANKE